MEYLIDIAAAAWNVTGEMSPYLLFGFLVAGFLSVAVSPEWVERHLGGRGFGPIFKSVLFGVPLPLCSCGVIAVTASIRRHGASRGAATGFLLATPQTGVDSILATWGVLGPVLGIFRPLVALVTGIVGGALVSWLDPDKAEAGEQGDDAPPSCAEACCTGPKTEHWAVRALRYGFITLPRDIAGALLIGVAIAGLIGALIPEGALAEYVGGGLLAMLAMIAVGIPLYVCSTASIPIAVGFLHMGASPGAALAFLIAGPATNAATIATVWRLMGHRTAIIYLSTVALASVLAGLGFDALVQRNDLMGFVREGHVHETGGGLLRHGWAVLLLGLLGLSTVWPRLEKRFKAQGHAEKKVVTSGSITLKVTGMTCSHCEEAVRRGLCESPGVESVEMDRPAERAVVNGADIEPDALISTVEKLGFSAEVDTILA